MYNNLKDIIDRIKEIDASLDVIKYQVTDIRTELLAILNALNLEVEERYPDEPINK